MSARAIAIALGLLALLARRADADDPIDLLAHWSTPEVVATTEGPVMDQTLIADSEGNLHLFYASGPPGTRPTSVRYTRRVDGRWTEPVTLIAPGGTATSPEVALDGRGYLHMLYEGPRWGLLEYRRVHLSRAADPKAWTRAQTISESGTFFSSLVATAEGQLHVVYAMHPGNVIYRQSPDGGRSWSAPVRVASIDTTREAAAGPKLVRDGRGRLHAVWTQYSLPKGWPPAGFWYARSLDDGRTWSEPRRMAGETYGEGTVFARTDDEIHLVWNALASVGDRTHAWSRDGGETWSAPALMTTAVRGGWTGQPAVGVDSAGTLHVVSSIDGPKSVERVVHLQWDGAHWSAPEFVSAGVEANESREYPTMAVTGGNELQVVFEGDFRKLWYRVGVTSAPTVAGVPVPTPAVGLGALLAEASAPLRVLLAGVALVALHAAGSGVWRWWRRGRR